MAISVEKKEANRLERERVEMEKLKALKEAGIELTKDGERILKETK